MIESKDFIDSSRYVLKHIEEKCADEEEKADKKAGLKEAEVCKIMKELGFRYRKVHHIALSANSNRSLVLR